MRSLKSTLLSGLAAAGMMGGFAGAAAAAPAGMMVRPAVAADAGVVTQVGWICDGSRGADCYDSMTGETRSRGEIRGGNLAPSTNGLVPPRDENRVIGRVGRDDGPRYVQRDRDRDYRRDDGWRRGDRDYRYRDRNRYRDNSGIFLEFNAAPRYRDVAPRRAYRAASSAHVSWCYNRWRSYDQYSNTYQPSRGLRRECISPYS